MPRRTMTGYFESTLCAAWCALPRSNKRVSRSISSAPRMAMRVMSAAMMTAVRMEPAALDVGLRSTSVTEKDDDHRLAAVSYPHYYFPYFVCQIRALAPNGRFKKRPATWGGGDAFVDANVLGATSSDDWRYPSCSHPRRRVLWCIA